MFQFVHLRHVNAGKGREFGLVRSRGECSLAPGARPEFQPTGFATSFVPPPGNAEQMLELEINPNGLASVRWNGRECEELVGERATESAKGLSLTVPFTGEYGIYCSGSSGIVTTARYVPNE